MRIVFIHPNYHSGGAEIAGNWPPAWVAYLAGSLKPAGFDDIHFLDAMTYHLGPDVLRAKLAELQPDIVGVTSITPSIYEAEEVLRIASEVVPGALRVLGGVHATFMFRQVLSEAPWVDVIVRGEGEEIMVALAEAVQDGRWPADNRKIEGLACAVGRGSWCRRWPAASVAAQPVGSRFLRASPPTPFPSPRRGALGAAVCSLRQCNPCQTRMCQV